MNVRRSVVSALLLAALPMAGLATVPRTLSFQGALARPALPHQPVSDGLYGVTLRLYDVPSGGAALWSETKNVAVSGGRGVFSAALGDTTAFPATLAFDVPYYVGVQIAGEAAEMSPRIALGSAPYALNAATSAGVALPYSGTVAAAGTAIAVTNTGAGGAITGSSASTASSATAVLGVLTSTAPGGFSSAVHGQNNGTATNGIGVWGSHAGGGYGVYGTSISGNAVRAESSTGTGVYASTNGGAAGAYGVYGINGGGIGVSGQGTTSGVYGYTAAGSNGVSGRSDGTYGNGVYGYANGGTSAYGVYGSTGIGRGVVGVSDTGDGVYGSSSSGHAVRATGSAIGLSAAALLAQNTATNGIAIWGLNSGNDATAVFSNGGGGDVVRGFGGASAGNLNFVVNNDGHTYSANGFDGRSAAGWGLYAVSGTNGQTTGRDGMIGYTYAPGYAGVAGVSLNTGPGIYGRSDGGGYAGNFDGKVRVAVLEIAGGSDVAEKFDVNEAAEPGTVLAIDPDNAGQLCVARGAYNPRVAGVVSGANKLSVGMVLPDANGAKNALPVAMTGRVWVKCSAANGPIRPGDMLTTSNAPGRAMRVSDHEKAQGAVIGKAMTALNSDDGLVLALVSLQ